MGDYIKNMEDYSPVLQATSQQMGEVPIKEMEGIPLITAVDEEIQPDDAPYMAPKTIEVRRYTLKK